MTTTPDAIARALCAECGRRIAGILHLRGLYRHVVLPGGRVACYGRWCDIPPDAPPTEAQRRADELQGIENPEGAA